MNEVKVKISIDDKEAIADLKKVGGAFDSLSIGAQKAAKGTEKLKTESSGAMIALKGFVTLELAKKVFAFADATLRGAKGMESLSKATKEGAGAYASMMDNTIGIAKNFLLWGTSLAPIKGTMETLSEMALSISRAFESSADKAARMREESNKAYLETLKTDEGKQQKLLSLRTKLRDLVGVAAGDFQTTDAGSPYQRTAEQRRTSAQNLALEAKKEYDKTAQEFGLSAQLATKFLYDSTVSLKQLINKELAGTSIESRKPAGSASLSTKPVAKDIANGKDEFWAWIDDQAQAREQERLDKFEFAKTAIEIDNKIYENELKNTRALIDAKKEAENTAMELRKKAQNDQLLSMQAGFGATAQMAGALSQLATVSAGKNKEMAKNALTLSEVVAIANVAEGVTKAFAQGGVLGFVTGGAVSIAGLAQIATIEQQKQKLADGGIIRGPSTGDTVQVQANGGEMMLTKSDQASVLQMIRGGGGGGNGITYAPVINSSNPAQVKQMLRENKSEFESFIVSTLRNPANSRARVFA
jgi:hypothetical protein